MPSFQHHGATIYYEEFGQGFPIVEAFQRSHLSGIDPGVLFAALERETAGAGLATVPAAGEAQGILSPQPV